MKYESARSFKFNFWLFFIANFAAISAAIYLTWMHKTSLMSVDELNGFKFWIESYIRAYFQPGAGLTGRRFVQFLIIVDEHPAIKNSFVSSANLIFKTAPLIAVALTTTVWIFAHAIRNYFRQTRK